ncbi:jg23119 [Pararge aegeria aegeria]|uniref:Jg23119 protein n=1 Tax=Pararge aegeria aegeria TaxID=348720 RepID=A0A8S4QVL5_9NEOP|nr:jg23119 [Pararge aegeria aegeria]
MNIKWGKSFQLRDNLGQRMVNSHDLKVGNKGFPQAQQADSVSQLTTNLAAESYRQLSSSAKIDRWFSLLPPPLSRPESGFVSGVEDCTEHALTEAKSLLLHLGAKKKRRLLIPRFARRKILINKHTLL